MLMASVLSCCYCSATLSNDLLLLLLLLLRARLNQKSLFDLEIFSTIYLFLLLLNDLFMCNAQCCMTNARALVY